MQVVSLVGAAIILGAYGLLQAGRLERVDASFNLANAIGAALLTAVAIHDLRWGFIVLEGAWTLLSLVGLRRPARGA
jgi:hypothetical protein